MDDLLTGADSERDAIRLRQELTQLFEKEGFNLRKWASNRSIVLKEEDQHRDPHWFLDLSESPKVLGIRWNPLENVFNYQLPQKMEQRKITKRSILSKVAALFDPLGLLSPVIVWAKIIIQELWKLKLEWDESVPMDVAMAWTKFNEKWEELGEMTIPRQVLVEELAGMELHGCCDASEKAYGACVYLRSWNRGETWVRLTAAKTRVAPLKLTSIPRLELCAAVLLSELYQTVRTALKRPLDRVILWSDSMITLNWIATPAYQLKTYVGNRVEQIQDLTQNCDWRHIPTADNPADAASRSITPEDLRVSSTWYTGPPWLALPEAECPISKIVPVEIPEQRQQTCLHATIEINDLLRRYSSIVKLKIVVAYCLRFLNCLKGDRRLVEALTVEEVQRAEIRIPVMVQQEVFQSEIRELKKGRELSSGSSLLSLNPFVDSNGLIRVGGLLQFEFKL